MHGRDSDRGRAAVASIHRSLHPAPKDFARTPIFHGQSVQAQAAGSGVPGVMSVTVFHNRYLLFAPPLLPHLAISSLLPFLPTFSPCIPPPLPGPLTSTLSLPDAALLLPLCPHVSLSASSPSSDVYMFKSRIYLFDLWRNLFFLL